MNRGDFRATTRGAVKPLKSLKAVSTIPPGHGGSPKGILASPEGVPGKRKKKEGK